MEFEQKGVRSRLAGYLLSGAVRIGAGETGADGEGRLARTSSKLVCEKWIDHTDPHVGLAVIQIFGK